MPRISTLTRYLPGWLLFLAVLISACSLVGNYQPRAHAQLTDLMAAHLQFIDDFTAPSGVLDTAALEDADTLCSCALLQPSRMPKAWVIRCAPIICACCSLSIRKIMPGY